MATLMTGNGCHIKLNNPQSFRIKTQIWCCLSLNGLVAELYGSCLRWWAVLMQSSRDSSCSLSLGAPDCLSEVSNLTHKHTFIIIYSRVCLMSAPDLRFPEPESPFDDREKDIWVDRKPGWLPPLSHDLCQLPEAAWLLQHRDHARETVDCGPRGPAVFPPLLISPHFTFRCLLQQLTKSRLPSFL